MATPIPSNEARFSLGEIARATGGTLRNGDAAREVRGVCTDSRHVAGGSLFVALVGETHDGHQHVATAAGRGAGAVLVRRGTNAAGPSIEVDDTLVALGKLARAFVDRGRATRTIPSVAITGSAGKTTTKELTAAAVAAVFGGTLATKGNLNNLIGVPMTLFTLSEEHRAMVIECGTNARREIERLGEIVAPDVGIVLNADAGHTAGIGGIEDVAIEKGAMFAAATSVAIANGDDPPSLGQLGRAKVRTMRFAANSDADVRLVDRVATGQGTSRIRVALAPTCIRDAADASLDVELKIPGHAAAIDACAAIAAVVAMRGPLTHDELTAVSAALATVAPTAGRFAPIAWREAVIIDDTYNANPRSVRASIATAREMADGLGGQLLLVLADMLELGELSPRLHAEIGEAAVTAGAVMLVAVGDEMRAAVDAARASSDSHARTMIIEHVTSASAAAAMLRDRIGARDVVLVKGSRGMRMEGVIAALGSGDHAVERVGP